MRIAMMGTGTFAEPTFEALLSTFGDNVVGLVTQPERDGGNKRGSTRQTGKGMANIVLLAGRASDEVSIPSLARPANKIAIAQQTGKGMADIVLLAGRASDEVGTPSLASPANKIAIAQPESINSPEGLSQLREMKPDLLVVAAYGQILSKDVLTVPTVGTINVHASLLPKYRGAAPVVYAILNGEKQTGVTIIKVTPGLDSGDMILQETIDILPDETTGEMEARLAVLGAKLAVEAVRMYQSGEPVLGMKQDPALVTKAPKIKKEFGLIDWSKPAEEICRHVRAMQPWPTAYTFLHRPGKEPMRVIVHRTEDGPVCPCGPDRPPPGTINCGGNNPVTGTVVIGVWPGDTQLVLLSELQPAGKKKMTAEEFLRGYPIVEGMRFGPEVPS